jgi:hypothetical protein
MSFFIHFSSCFVFFFLILLWCECDIDIDIDIFMGCVRLNVDYRGWLRLCFFFSGYGVEGRRWTNLILCMYELEF